MKGKRHSNLLIGEMIMKKLTFKSYSLLVDENYPDPELLKQINELPVRRSSCGDYSYKYSTRYEEGKFLFISVDYDDGKYSDIVYDTENDNEKENPKKRYEIEYKEQFFACYDIINKELYISDSQRKAAIKSLFSTVLTPDKKTRIRERLSSVEDFADTVKLIRRIKYTQTKNLVTAQPGGLFSQRFDPLGLEIPDKLVSTLEYDSGIHVKPIIDKLRGIFNKHGTKEIESLEILGEDDEGFERLFSLDKIVKGLSIDIDPDEDGRYDSEAVFSLLLEKLKG